MEIVKQRWSKEAKIGLSLAMGEDGLFIENEVKSGAADLWQIVGQGWLVTRLECNELVFVAGQGVHAKSVIKAFMEQAKKLNIKTCRIHSARVGMGRYLSSVGFKEVERVYRAVI